MTSMALVRAGACVEMRRKEAASFVLDCSPYTSALSINIQQNEWTWSKKMIIIKATLLQ